MDKEVKNRKIKQVFISPSGREESVVISDEGQGGGINSDNKKPQSVDIESFRADAKKAEKDIENSPAQHISVIGESRPNSVDNEKLLREEARHKREKRDSKRRKLKLLAVLIAVVFSTIFAAGMGTVLAIWDTNSSIQELNNALFQKEVMAATNVEASSKNNKATDKSQKSDNKGADNTSASLTKSSIDNATSNSSDSGSSKSTSDKETVNKGDSKSSNSGADKTVNSDLVDTTSLSGSSSGDEISGIGAIARAGSEDVLESTEAKDPTEGYPLEFTTVDEEYFKDALFIGDSRLHGFGMWSGLESTFYTAVGFQLYKYDTTKVVQTENGKVPILEAMPDDAFTKVYIKVGLNEMDYNETKFENIYAELIAKIREKEPRAIIYIHGLLPVTSAKAAEGTYTNAKIDKRNEALKQFAATQKVYFVDAGEAYKDSNGCLPANMSSDGIHLKAEYMKDWTKYLCEHAIVLN